MPLTGELCPIRDERERGMVHVAYLDFSKASVTVSGCVLTAKFMSYGLGKWTIKREEKVAGLVVLKSGDQQ